MWNKIKTSVSAYFLLLNMNPRAARLARRIQGKEEKKDTPVRIHVLLFVITIITTTIAGAHEGNTIFEIILSGLPFSMTIITILLSHEMGHYLAARHFGVKATLPYFIPFPSIIGTMGAVIKIKSPIQDRRALLFIGAAGPLIGFILSLIAAVVGIYLSEIKALPIPVNDQTPIPIFGDSILFSLITRLIHGSIPPGHDIFLSPYAWAGWIGFLVTSLNLMPMGQLDGSHILYALIGRKQVFVGWAAFIALIALSFIWLGWAIWVILVLVFLMIGHPPIEEGPMLSRKEKAIGWSCIIIFIITFIPVPVDFLEAAKIDARVYPIKCSFCDTRLEPSGISMANKSLLFVSDNENDSAVYELLKEGGHYTTGIYQRISPADLKGIPRSFNPDLEGIVNSARGFFIADERDRFIYRVKGKDFQKIEHDIFAYNRKNNIVFSQDENAGFEGIALDEKNSIMYIANERDRAIIYRLKLKKDKLTTLDHIDMEKVSGAEDLDISDLFFNRGRLYLLYRKGRKIIKLSPDGKKISNFLSYSGITENLYKSSQGYGFAEGLYLTDHEIYLLLDSGGRKINNKDYGEHGALIIMQRPGGF